VELLVSIGIVALLIGLILPAVQSSRETARRMQCLANLRQLGIALHAYQADMNMFPPGKTTRGARSDFEYSSLSALISILPNLEQQTLFDSVNFDLAWQDSPETPIVQNATARRTNVAAFLCPSDSEANHRVNYRLNRGIWRTNLLRNLVLDVGPFATFFVATPASVTDGLSRTAFMSERLGGDFVPGSRDPRRNFLNAFDSWAGFETEDQSALKCLSDPEATWVPFAGRYWLYTGDAFTLYHHLGRPNDARPSCFHNYIRALPWMGFAPPRSNHPGGVNLLFGDGHVEWAKDSVNEALWRALGTPASGD